MQKQLTAKSAPSSMTPASAELREQETSLRELAEDLRAKFTFILGAAHDAAYKRLPRRSRQKNKKKVGHSDEEDSEAEEDQPIITNDKNTIDFLDIVAGVNFKVENHRKRLRYIENLDTATAHTPIVIAVKKAEIDIAGLKQNLAKPIPQTTIIKEISA